MASITFTSIWYHETGPRVPRQEPKIGRLLLPPIRSKTGHNCLNRPDVAIKCPGPRQPQQPNRPSPQAVPVGVRGCKVAHCILTVGEKKNRRYLRREIENVWGYF